MYQFESKNQADVLLPLDLSAIFFVLIDQQIKEQNGLYQGVIPALQVQSAHQKVLDYLHFLHLYLEDASDKNANLEVETPEQIKINTYAQKLQNDYQSFYRYNQSLQTLLWQKNLKQRLLPITEMLAAAVKTQTEVLFKKLN